MVDSKEGRKWVWEKLKGCVFGSELCVFFSGESTGKVGGAGEGWRGLETKLVGKMDGGEEQGVRMN